MKYDIKFFLAVALGVISFFKLLFDFSRKTKIEILIEKQSERNRDLCLILLYIFSVLSCITLLFLHYNATVFVIVVLISFVITLIWESVCKKFSKKIEVKIGEDDYHIVKRIGDSDKFIFVKKDSENFRISELPDSDMKISKKK